MNCKTLSCKVMERESIFLLYVRQTLRKWAGLQAAIEDGMGGLYAREKEAWLGSEIENYFKKYEDVRPEDIESYMGTMIENEFDTYFEDGSLAEVSQLFCHAYEIYLTDPEAQLFQQFMPKHEPNFPPVVEMQCDEECQENIVASKMEGLAVSDTEDDGWTIVNRKSKRNKQ